MKSKMFATGDSPPRIALFKDHCSNTSDPKAVKFAAAFRISRCFAYILAWIV